jgi:hypothetical protein
MLQNPGETYFGFGSFVSIERWICNILAGVPNILFNFRWGILLILLGRKLLNTGH